MLPVTKSLDDAIATSKIFNVNANVTVWQFVYACCIFYSVHLIDVDWWLDELCKVQSMLEEIRQRNAELNDKLQRQMTELDDVKTAAAVAESVKLDEIDNVRHRCAEEIATLQQLMKGLLLCCCCTWL